MLQAYPEVQPLPMIKALEPDASNRGVSAQWLLDDFVPRAEKALNGSLGNATTKQVVEIVIKGHTASDKCAYVQLMDSSAPPDFFIAHMWHRPFAELVHCLREHSKRLPPGAVIWMDIFAFNQHIAFEEMKADLGTLASTVQQTQKTLVVIDPEGICFTRAWCLKEFHEAIKAGGSGAQEAGAASEGAEGSSAGGAGKLELMPYCLKTDDSEKLAEMMYNIQVARSTATKIQDKETIVKEIEEHEGGVARFDTVLKGALRAAVAAMPGLLQEGTKEHLDMMATAGDLLLKGGDYGRAEPLLEKALEGRRRALGGDHPDTRISDDKLADLYCRKGDYARAEPLLVQALEGRRKALGEDHPSTLTSINNLAGLYGDKGDFGRAEPLLVQALEGRRRALGEDHPDTLDSIGSLAILYSEKGDCGRAEPLYLQALEGARRVLGEDHPSTLTSINNLALLYSDKGDYERAEPLYVQAVEGMRRALGEDHPAMLASIGNLANLYKAMGDYGRAEPLCVQALEGMMRALGEDNPSTLTSIGNLAVLYSDKGDYGRAEPLYVQALQGRRRALGKDHPDTLASINNLGSLYYRKGDYGRAEPLYVQAVEGMRRALGEDHPDTRQSQELLELVRRMLSS